MTLDATSSYQHNNIRLRTLKFVLIDSITSQPEDRQLLLCGLDIKLSSYNDFQLACLDLIFITVANSCALDGCNRTVDMLTYMQPVQLTILKNRSRRWNNLMVLFRTCSGNNNESCSTDWHGDRDLTCHQHLGYQIQCPPVSACQPVMFSQS